MLLVLGGLPICGQDTVELARQSALKGDRLRALQLLAQRLDESPGDTDARTLYGTVLSWDGQLQQARMELERVLQDSPRNADAMQALANVELRSGDPGRAEAVLAGLMKTRQDDPDLLHTWAKVMIALKRNGDARDVINRLLRIDPNHKDALRLSETLSTEGLVWKASVHQFHEWFSDGIGNRRETQLSLERQTSVGPAIGRYSNAASFGLTDNQVEIDLYPLLRKGTYLYLNAGYSPEAVLYPQYRVGSDIFQSLGGGFEASIGYRRLGFSNAVDIFTAGLSKYQGPWLFTVRGYFAPDPARASRTYQLSARRYAADSVSFFEVRYGHGSTPANFRTIIDIGIRSFNSLEGSFTKRFRGRWLASGMLGISREDRINRPIVEHYNASGSLGYRF
jgi:YaiO family outer membrane protein